VTPRLPLAFASALVLVACGGGTDHPGLSPTTDAAIDDGAILDDGPIDDGGLVCTEGAVRACRVTLDSHNGIIDCLDSTQVCSGGAWLRCGESAPAPLPGVCTADLRTYSSAALQLSASTPAAFRAAWTDAANQVKGGLVLLELSGVATGVQNVSVAIGSSDGATPPNLQSGTYPRATGPGTVDKASRSFTASLGSFTLSPPDATTDPNRWILVSAASVAGTLDAKCASATHVTLTLDVPSSEGSKRLGTATLDSLLGAPSQLPSGDVGWAIELDGDAALATR
jgi:hypothetical protein